MSYVRIYLSEPKSFKTQIFSINYIRKCRRIESGLGCILQYNLLREYVDAETVLYSSSALSRLEDDGGSSRAFIYIMHICNGARVIGVSEVSCQKIFNINVAWLLDTNYILTNYKLTILD